MTRADLFICPRESSACHVISHTFTRCRPIFFRGLRSCKQQKRCKECSKLNRNPEFVEFLIFSGVIFVALHQELYFFNVVTFKSQRFPFSDMREKPTTWLYCLVATMQVISVGSHDTFKQISSFPPSLTVLNFNTFKARLQHGRSELRQLLFGGGMRGCINPSIALTY